MKYRCFGQPCFFSAWFFVFEKCILIWDVCILFLRLLLLCVLSLELVHFLPIFLFPFYLGKSSDFLIFYINIIFVGSNMRCDQTEYVQCWIKKNIIYEIKTNARVIWRDCNNMIYEWYSYVTSSFTGYVLMHTC